MAATPALVLVPNSAATYTVETLAPRDTAMHYAKRLVRDHGVRLRHINFRRGPDGVTMVSAPGCLTVRFEAPKADEA